MFTKNRFVLVFLFVFLTLIAFPCQTLAAKRTSRSVSSASELEQAFKDGVTDITITSSLRGNFVIPRWVCSISGNGSSTVISPVDSSKPAFYTESAAKGVAKKVATTALSSLGVFVAVKGAADTLTLSDMTIKCGKGAGINADPLSKPVFISNVTFEGNNFSGEECLGCFPSTRTVFDGCIFENLTWCVSTISISDYDLHIDSCTFRFCKQALSVDKSGSRARASITGCKGGSGWLTVLHEPDSKMIVTIDQSTLDSCNGGDFFHKIVEDLKDDRRRDDKKQQFEALRKNFNETFGKLNGSLQSVKVVIGKYSEPSIDEIRMNALSDLQERLSSIDPQDSNMTTDELEKRISDCMFSYVLLAVAPACGILYEGNIFRGDNPPRFELFSDVLDNIVKDNNLIHPIIRAFRSNQDLALLGRTSGNIYWGDSGNVRDAFASSKSINDDLDRIFRERLHSLQDWMEAMNTAETEMKKLRDMTRKDVSRSFSAEMDRTLRCIRDLATFANRVHSAIHFDLPTDILLASAYAKACKEAESHEEGWFKRKVSDAGKSRIIDTLREVGPIYSVSKHLCVLPSTNTLRMELIKVWKGMLGADEETLESYLGTDPDLMRDANKSEEFFRTWR